MPWIATLLRIGATLVPGTAPLLQAMAELDAAEVERRLRELEDPISTIHPGVAELATELYQRLPAYSPSATFELTDDFMQEWWRPLHLLDGQQLIKLRHTLGAPPRAVSSMNPLFVAYMAQRAEDARKMREIARRIEECEPGKWVNGKVVSDDMGIPLPVTCALMKIYESGGYGVMSRELGTANYLGRA
jgi:hypothetical protein